MQIKEGDVKKGMRENMNRNKQPRICNTKRGKYSYFKVTLLFLCLGVDVKLPLKEFAQMLALGKAPRNLFSARAS